MLIRLITVASTLLTLSLQANELPHSDILLGDLSTQANTLSINNIDNITQRAGYDNQPYFLADGQQLLYTSSRKHGEQQQTDIIHYQLSDRHHKNLTQSAASEYSPTPNQHGFSVIRVAADQKQYLWQYSATGKAQKPLLDIQPVGYHTWVDEQGLILFILGKPHTLQYANTQTQTYQTLDDNIGASLFQIPNTERFSYSKATDTQQSSWVVKSVDPQTGKQQELVKLPESAYYYAWTPDKRLIAAQKSVLMQWQQGQKKWQAFADVSKSCPKGISRLAVNPQQTKIAMVCSL